MAIKLTRTKADGTTVTMTTSEAMARKFLAEGVWSKLEAVEETPDLGATPDADNERKVSPSEPEVAKSSGKASEKKRTPQRKTRAKAAKVIQEMRE